MRFEWDEKKSEANLQAHEIDFNHVPEIFNSPMMINLDDRFPYDEERYIGVGFLRNIIAVVAFVEKERDVIRIISARKANKHESKSFEREINNQLG